jgi:hypothetical protein
LLATASADDAAFDHFNFSVTKSKSSRGSSRANVSRRACRQREGDLHRTHAVLSQISHNLLDFTKKGHRDGEQRRPHHRQLGWGAEASVTANS